jgi:hypothetical protein
VSERHGVGLLGSTRPTIRMPVKGSLGPRLLPGWGMGSGVRLSTQASVMLSATRVSPKARFLCLGAGRAVASIALSALVRLAE